MKEIVSLLDKFHCLNYIETAFCMVEIIWDTQIPNTPLSEDYLTNVLCSHFVPNRVIFVCLIGLITSIQG